MHLKYEPFLKCKGKPQSVNLFDYVEDSFLYHCFSIFLFPFFHCPDFENKVILIKQRPLKNSWFILRILLHQGVSTAKTIIPHTYLMSLFMKWFLIKTVLSSFYFHMLMVSSSNKFKGKILS